MTTHSAPVGVPAPQKPPTPSFVLLTPKEAAKLLKVSLSWLAKARMRGDGPPYIQISPRSIRYALPALLQWMKSKQRMSTSEH
jgi:predicted DNA-binding transcriptional regulator AlpA